MKHTRHAAIALGIVTLCSSSLAQAVTTIATCPITIDSPGNYRLADDLTCLGDGIVITSGGVSLRMGQHVLTGNGTGIGITISDVDRNVDIASGTVTGFAIGVVVSNAHGVDMRYVTSIANQTGMVLDHCTDSTFANTIVVENAGNGIEAYDSSAMTITASLADQNGDAGLVGQGFAGNLLTGCGFHDNVGDGLRLETGSDENTLRANDASTNGGDGVVLAGAEGNSVTSNRANGNGGSGFRVEATSTDNVLRGNSARGNALVDAADLNPNPCSANTWQRNTFDTDSEGDGSKRGCIQ
jgi:parallel beta-helix repeat protein